MEDNSLDELEELFGGSDSEIEAAERVTLKQNLDGFASCFPDWDLQNITAYS